MIPKWRQYCDKSIGSISQGEGAEFVKNILSVGDYWKQPVGILLIDALREERNDSEKFSGVGADFSKQWGGEGEFYRGYKAPGVLCVKSSRLLFLPFLGQSIDVPFVVPNNSCKQDDGERMEVQLSQNLVDRVRPFAPLVDPVERLACRLHRQCWDLEYLAVGGDGGDARGNAKTDVAEPSQLVHNRADLLCTWPLGIENGFCIVEDYYHLL